MAMHDYPSTTQPRARERLPLQQGELFARLMLQPLPLFKHGPEDELSETRH